jgi:hypothetical protein
LRGAVLDQVAAHTPDLAVLLGCAVDHVRLALIDAGRGARRLRAARGGAAVVELELEGALLFDLSLVRVLAATLDDRPPDRAHRRAEPARGRSLARERQRRVWVVDGYEERAAAQLCAYCGHGDPLRSRHHAGITQEELFKQGNPAAKKAAWKLGYQFMRTPSSPYRNVYVAARERYTDKLHVRSCSRCGPSGRPALPGSPWSEDHKHHAAIRNTTHAFLTDLWSESPAPRFQHHRQTRPPRWSRSSRRRRRAARLSPSSLPSAALSHSHSRNGFPRSRARRSCPERPLESTS